MDAGKEPWEVYPEIWKTKAAFFTWLRGAVRRAIWEKYPAKIQFKNDNCSLPPKGYTGKARSGAYCSLSGEWIGKSKLQVDHIIGHASLRDWSDFEGFVKHLTARGYGRYENFQLVGKKAHEVKSYAEKMGISYEEALIEKQVIAFAKLPAKAQIALLQKMSQEQCDLDLSSAGKRKSFYRKLVQGGSNVN